MQISTALLNCSSLEIVGMSTFTLVTQQTTGVGCVLFTYLFSTGYGNGESDATIIMFHRCVSIRQLHLKMISGLAFS